LSLEIWLAIKSAERGTVTGRIVNVMRASANAEYALLGYSIKLDYKSSIRQGLVFNPGFLIRTVISMDIVDSFIDKIAAGDTEEPHIVVDEIRPINEPCVRVPLSLFMSLRGQEAVAEMQRRALVRAWSEDRKTGK